MCKIDRKSQMAAGGLAVLVAVLCGCGGGDGDGGGAIGSSTISGAVVEVDAGQVRTGLVAPYTGMTSEGVSIRVEGTELAATTADDGFFILSGVPSGMRTLVFEAGGMVAKFTVEVPPNAQVNMPNIRIRGGSVISGHIEVELLPEPVDNTSTNGQSDDDEVEVRGLIEALSPGAITVAGTTFTIGSSTRVLDDNNVPTTLAAFSVGDIVEVEGDLVSGQLVARKIKREDDLFDGNDDDHDDDDHDDDHDDDDDDDHGNDDDDD